MPFDAGLNTDPLHRPLLFVETDGSEFVPDIGHISPELVLLAGGELLAMIRAPGFPDLASMRARNIRRRQLNDLFRGISDDNVTLSVHLVHHDHVPPFPLGQFRSRFARRLMETYAANCLGGLVANDWFISIVVSPRFSPTKLLRRRLSFGGRRRHATAASDATVRQINSIMASLMSYLGAYGSRRLGLRRDENGYLCSEIAEARALMLTGRWRPIPLTTGLLSSAIYTDRVTCGTQFIRIDGLDGPISAKTISLRDYPSETRTGQFSHFTKLVAEHPTDPTQVEQFPFVMGQSFRFQAREAAATRLYLKLTKMQNSWSVEKRGMENIDDAREDVVSGETVRGHHNFALTVFGPTQAAVRRAVSAAGTAMNSAGAVPIGEDGGSFAAYWTILPGQSEYLECRSGAISAHNLTAFAPLEGFPEGATEGHWGPALMRFATSGSTIYDLVPHVGDVGHTIVLGGTGRGKTVLLTLVLCALEQATINGGTVVFFDKDQGAEPVIRATGGTYLTLKAGEDSGLNPLRGLTNTPANRAFLEQLILAMITSDGRGPIATQTVDRLRRGVARQMRLPPEHRSITAVRAFLGFGEGTDGERLAPWCHDGSVGWLFDGATDDVRLDAHLVGFDMTQLLKHAACPLVGAYLVHRIADLIDGRRLAVICDECRFYLLSPLFAAMIEDFALTLRKKNGMLWLAAQSPDHITKSTVGRSLAAQAQTIFAFPSNDADPDEFVGKLGFTVPMFKALTETVLPYRWVLMRREEGSVILRVDLKDMADEISVLSGREETARLIPGIRADVGDDPEAFTAEFTRRVKAMPKNGKAKAP